jgi:hypothetical protein
MTYQTDIINLVIDHVSNNKTYKEISLILNISRQCINRWRKKYFSNFENKTPVTNDLMKSLNSLHKNNKVNTYRNNIISYVNSNEGCSLKEIKEHATNNIISNSTICKLLKKENISHKRINNRIICKDIALIEQNRKDFVSNINYDIKDIIFIDESSFCITDLKRYGYSFKGKEIKKLIKHKHNKKTYTTIAAISYNKIIDVEILEGTVNREIYKNFLIKNKELFLNKTIIQDNATALCAVQRTCSPKNPSCKRC